MKICPLCNARFRISVSSCPLCRQNLLMLKNDEEGAPGRPGTGFRPEYFAELAQLEASSFWFQSRNRLLIWALGRYFPLAESFLEVGCGTGFVLEGIEAAFPRLAVFGAETYTDGLVYAANRLKRGGLFHRDVRELAFKEMFDVVGAFDVLEHLKEDAEALERIYGVVRPEGGIMVTVPQHPWLWSRQDEFACHVRRYRAGELKARLAAAGFEMVRLTSFVSLLLPLMLLSRLQKAAPTSNADPMTELKISPFINRFFKAILNIERRAISAGLSFPAGGSLLAVAKKTSSPKYESL